MNRSVNVVFYVLSAHFINPFVLFVPGCPLGGWLNQIHLRSSVVKKKAMKILGLMAGTSLDGIDAALCEIEGTGAALKAQLLTFECVPYAQELRERLLRAGNNEADVREVARLDVEVAQAFASAANLVFDLHGRAELIASHGQTICHLPEDGVTLQIGEGQVLAERTGVTVVSNFRPRDLACGGQGAPLVPYADWVLLRHPTKNRVVLNIGGIANCTILPSGCSLDEVRAWDTGPGNMLLDLAAKRTFGWDYDPGGSMAHGLEVEELVSRALQHEFFERHPPKSAGREQFGDEFLDRFEAASSEIENREAGLEENSWSAHDLLANLTRFSARSIAESVRRFSGFGADFEMIVGGGGVHNQTLMKMLREEIAPAPLLTLEEVGLNSDAKEALAFAILGSETLRGVATSVPGATGAKRASVLGQIAPGQNFHSLFARS
jgi:anhydro-N-acetylmuramic acid kinase